MKPWGGATFGRVAYIRVSAVWRAVADGLDMWRSVLLCSLHAPGLVRRGYLDCSAEIVCSQ